MRRRNFLRIGLVLTLALGAATTLATQSLGGPGRRGVQESPKGGSGGASAMSASGLDYIEPGAVAPIELFAGVTAIGTPPLGRICPTTWLFFANPIMHYDFCYPNNWGFNDGDSAQAMLTIPGPELYGGVQLMSSSAFPWVVGDLSMDAAVQKNAALLNFMVLEPHVALAGCVPSTPITLIGASGQWCSESARSENGEVVLDPLGNINLMKVSIPLTTDPVAPSSEEDTTDYELLLYVRTSQTGWTNLQATIFQIVNNLRPL